MNKEKIEKKVEEKKWQRPGRVAVCGQIPQWMADKILEVANNNKISRTKVLEDALDCYFNNRRVEVEVVKEVEVPRQKTEFEIDLKDLALENFAAIIELSQKMQLSYLQTIEIICKYIIKREGNAEEKYIKIAKQIKIK